MAYIRLYLELSNPEFRHLFHHFTPYRNLIPIYTSAITNKIGYDARVQIMRNFASNKTSIDDETDYRTWRFDY